MGAVKVEQRTFTPPTLTVKDLLSSIPQHCFQRSALYSSLYIVMDVVAIAATYFGATAIDAHVKSAAFPSSILTSLPPAALEKIPPHALLAAQRHLTSYAGIYTEAAGYATWILYGFIVGLFGTGLWVIAHECGHQAFSASKAVNNTVGWVLHSALGVPYHSWRISHAKHHASTGHLTQDQVFVPKTRTQLGLPPLKDGEDVFGSESSEEIMGEMREAIGDSPLGAMFGAFAYLLVGWPAYIIRNASGQKRYPKDTNHFNPSSVIFAPHQYNAILVSIWGIALWAGALGAWTYYRGFAEVFKLYVVPYLWVNHWLVLITFLQHTDPLLPHYRAGQFTFPRGALCTFDRHLMGDCGPIMKWIGATVTHGISETHVLHHVCSKIPHYHAWEASEALKQRLAKEGLVLEGKPVGWAEMYRVFKACRFVEDEGDVVFYKDARGLAQVKPAMTEVADSAVEISQ